MLGKTHTKKNKIHKSVWFFRRKKYFDSEREHFQNQDGRTTLKRNCCQLIDIILIIIITLIKSIEIMTGMSKDLWCMGKELMIKTVYEGAVKMFFRLSKQ